MEKWKEKAVIAMTLTIFVTVSYLAFVGYQRKLQLREFAEMSSSRVVVLTEFNKCRSGLNPEPAEYCVIEAAAFAGLKISEKDADKAALELARFMGIEVPILERKAGGLLQGGA